MDNLNTSISEVPSESLESILWDIKNCSVPCDGNIGFATSTSVLTSEPSGKRGMIMDSNVNVLQPPMDLQNRIASDVLVGGNHTVPCDVQPEPMDVLQPPMNQQNQPSSDGPMATLLDIENCTVPCDIRPEDVNLIQPPMNQQTQTTYDGPVSILWDIENCCVPSDVRPEDVAGNIRMALRANHVINGAVVMFSAYGDFNAFPVRLREGCQRTGVKLIDVPNGRKDAADKAILVDMFLFALDNPPPSSIVLISGDVDFAPALHILGQRGYTVILVIPGGHVSSALCSAGKFVWDWRSMARGVGSVPPSKLLMPPQGAQMVEQVVTEEKRKNGKNQNKRCLNLACSSPPASAKRARKKQKSGSTAKPRQQTTSLANSGGSQSANIFKCGHCHKRHVGECRRFSGACFGCGSKDHILRDCTLVVQLKKSDPAVQKGNGKNQRVPTETISHVIMVGEEQDAPDVIIEN